MLDSYPEDLHKELVNKGCLGPDDQHELNLFNTHNLGKIFLSKSNKTKFFYPIQIKPGFRFPFSCTEDFSKFRLRIEIVPEPSNMVSLFPFNDSESIMDSVAHFI